MDPAQMNDDGLVGKVIIQGNPRQEPHHPVAQQEPQGLQAERRGKNQSGIAQGKSRAEFHLVGLQRRMVRGAGLKLQKLAESQQAADKEFFIVSILYHTLFILSTLFLYLILKP